MQVLKQHLLTVTEYFSIGELQNKTELINGVIYDMVPPGPGHSYVVGKIAKYLITSLNDEIVRQEQPVQLLPVNAPQPDFAILKPGKMGYKTSHPQASDVIALIEVSDTTLSYDSNEKMRLYAQANIPLYFIVDLQNKKILKHTDPGQNGYKKIQASQAVHIESLSVLMQLRDIA